MHNAQKNLLVLGLYRPDDYWELPVVGNVYGAPWGFSSLWLLSPALLAIPGVCFLRTRRRRVIRLRHFRVTEERRLILPGALCLAAAVLLLVNNFPFRRAPVSPYDAERAWPRTSRLSTSSRRAAALPSGRSPRPGTTTSSPRADCAPRSTPTLTRPICCARIASPPSAGSTRTRPPSLFRAMDGTNCSWITSTAAAPPPPGRSVRPRITARDRQESGSATVQTVVLAERKDAADLLEGLRAGRAYALFRTQDDGLSTRSFSGDRPPTGSSRSGQPMWLCQATDPKSRPPSEP